MLVIKREWMEIRFYDDCSIYQRNIFSISESLFFSISSFRMMWSRRSSIDIVLSIEIVMKWPEDDGEGTKIAISTAAQSWMIFISQSTASAHFISSFFDMKKFSFSSAALFVLVNESKEIIMCNNDLAQGSKVFGGWKKNCRLNGFIVIRLDCMSSLFHSLLYFFADPLRRLSDDVWCVLLLFFAAPSHHDVLVRASWANQCAHNGWVYCATEIFVGFSGLAREKRENSGAFLLKNHNKHTRKGEDIESVGFSSLFCVFSAVVPLRQ